MKLKKKGKWFEGDFFMFSSKKMIDYKKFGEGVMKPTAIQRRKRKGKMYSRYYYKPIQEGEFWD